jgi:hypothetical protein
MSLRSVLLWTRIQLSHNLSVSLGCNLWPSHFNQYQERHLEACIHNIKCRCHSGFVPARKCSGGTYPLANLFPRNVSASGHVPPGTFSHLRKCSGPRKCSELAHFWFDRRYGGPGVKAISIAYATSMAFGVDPCCYKFNQASMRRHLYQCFLKRQMTPFPHSAARNTRPLREERWYWSPPSLQNAWIEGYSYDWMYLL